MRRNPVPYVRADRVSPDMIDRAARGLAQLWADFEWDKLEPEAVDGYRRDAEAVLTAALGVEEPEAKDARRRAHVLFEACWEQIYGAFDGGTPVWTITFELVEGGVAERG